MSTTAKLGNEVINIIHFNDVYNINPVVKTHANGEIKAVFGGAARFKAFVNKLSGLNPIVLFSGDFLSPSDMSTVTKGEHMVAVMNEIGITCGMIGNHDLDYGNAHCIEMLAKLNYPTVNTNIFTPTNGVATGDVDVDSKLDLEPLGKCVTSHVFKHNDNINVGVIGISENWSNTLPIKPENGLVYFEFIAECQKYVTRLRSENQIDLMIVLSHSRLLNDQLMASKVEGVDVILGGHDHMYYCGMHEDTKTMIVKSGTDFMNVSWLQLQANSDKTDANIHQNEQTKTIEAELTPLLNEKKGPYIGSAFTFVNRYYNIDMQIAPDANTEKLVHALSAEFQEQMAHTIGYLAADIDCRFSVVRARESTAGNFVADVVRRAYHCDAVMLCGGALRADRVMSAGKFTYKDILQLVPFQDSIVVIQLKGSAIINVLEHSVSGVPKAEGRFPQISGLRFLYDGREKIGSRVKKVWISRYVDEGIHNFYKSMSSMRAASATDEHKAMEKMDKKDDEHDDDNNGDAEFEQFELIEEDAIYTVATREYLANGGDGFEAFKTETVRTIVDGEAGIPMSTILRNFFWAVDTVNRLMKIANGQEQRQHVDKQKQRLRLLPMSTKTSMLQTESSQSTDVTQYANQLMIQPQLEHRIMTVDEELDLQGAEFTSMQGFFSRLPSFVNLQHLPRKQSLLVLLDDNDKEKD